MIFRYGISQAVVLQVELGPLCPTILDVALTFDAMDSLGPEDLLTAVDTINSPPRGRSYAATLGNARSSAPCMGVVSELLGPDEDSEMVVVNTCVRGALAELRESRATVVHITIPGLKQYAVETSLYRTQNQNDLDHLFATNR